jgi:hypothetical protein
MSAGTIFAYQEFTVRSGLDKNIPGLEVKSDGVGPEEREDVGRSGLIV